FSGTSAAAAYVAAQAALIRSNTNTNINPAGQTAAQFRDRMINYMLTHSIDLYSGAQPDGFDSQHGAGMPVLGNPAPDYPVFNPFPDITAIPPDSGCSSTVYAGHPNPLGMNLTVTQGSTSNPY